MKIEVVVRKILHKYDIDTMVILHIGNALPTDFVACLMNNNSSDVKLIKTKWV